MKNKKTITKLLIICLLASCSRGEKEIRFKGYKNENKPCICDYTYANYWGTIWFQDSCNKYNIGDTIK